jgi:hypothetical protein
MLLLSDLYLWCSLNVSPSHPLNYVMGSSNSPIPLAIEKLVEWPKVNKLENTSNTSNIRITNNAGITMTGRNSRWQTQPVEWRHLAREPPSPWLRNHVRSNTSIPDGVLCHCVGVGQSIGAGPCSP